MTGMISGKLNSLNELGVGQERVWIQEPQRRITKHTVRSTEYWIHKPEHGLAI